MINDEVQLSVMVVCRNGIAHETLLWGDLCVGGFLLAWEDLGRMFNNSFPASAFFLSFFFEVEISSRTLIPLFKPGSVHSG